MSLFNVFNVTGSAMSAESVRLNTTSSNLANADSVSSSAKDTYKARHAVFGAELSNAMRGGDTVPVKVMGIVESDKPLSAEYNPDHPLANDEGYIYKPNVNVMEEMAFVHFRRQAHLHLQSFVDWLSNGTFTTSPIFSRAS